MSPRLRTSVLGLLTCLWLAAPTFAAVPVAPVGLPAAVSDAAAKVSPLLVQARFSNDHPVFGDTLELNVTLTYPSTVRAFFPARPSLRPLLVDARNPGKTSRVEHDGKVTETMSIPVLAVRSGLVKTPPIEVPWHEVTASGGAGESGTVTVPSLRLEIRSQFASENEVKPEPLPAPQPLVEENLGLEIGLLVLAMMLVAAALTLVGLRIYKARAARNQPKPQVAPHILAYGRLESLLRSGRVETDEPRVILGELSEILREYLGGRFRFHALDMTSTELLEALKRVDLRGVTLEEVRDFTDTSDLVKFAGMPAPPEELERILGFVRHVVDRTVQTPVELQRLRDLELARLARQKRLRIEVMAPAQLRLRALAVDVLIGAVATALVVAAARRDGNQGLLLGAYGLLFLWLAVRDALGGTSPGKALMGLQIAAFDSTPSAQPRSWRPGLEDEPESGFETAQVASWPARLQRNLLMLLPVGGLVAEALTTLALPEQRRLGDQWAGTRVIDGKHGSRKGKPSWLPAVVLLVLAGLLLVVTPLLVEPGQPDQAQDTTAAPTVAPVPGSTPGAPAPGSDPGKSAPGGTP
jgi:hypothetical protein